MKMNDRIKRFIRSYLNVEEANGNANEHIMIRKTDSFAVQQLKNEVWYNGNVGELQQFYENYQDNAGNSMFWRGKSSTGMPIRKIHTGLPALIIDKIVDIVVDDMGDITITKSVDGKGVNDTSAIERWNEIAKEHDFKSAILKDAVKKALLGDAAFKISIDPDVSDYPIIEVKKAREFDIEYKRGRMTQIIFYSHYLVGKKSYYLEDIYSRGKVGYKLFDDSGREVELSRVPELSELVEATYNRDMMLAIPLIITPSSEFEGRGKSLFDGKEGAFDSIDEVWSQWMDAIRLGRTTKYIPENLLLKDEYTGVPKKPNSFDNQYIAIGSSLEEGAKNEINIKTPDILASQYLASYVTALDLGLQGIISPSTLGIDVKKLDNAESQREKEKTTLYTRSKVVERLEKIVPLLVETVLKADDINRKNQPGNYEVSVNFGEYANPSFEAQVETVGKAKQQGIMSLERSIEELYGDSLTEEEKNEEVKRLKLEQGLVEEPQVNDFDI